MTTKYVKAVGGTVIQYPYTINDFKAEYTNVSIPAVPTAEQLAAFDLYMVNPVAQPPYDLNFNIVEATPTETSPGVWDQVWNQVPASAEEIAERQEVAKTEAESAELKADAFIQTFIAMTPAEVRNYVDVNVTDLASAKDVIDKLAVMLLLLARREYG